MASSSKYALETEKDRWKVILLFPKQDTHLQKIDE